MWGGEGVEAPQETAAMEVEQVEDSKPSDKQRWERKVKVEEEGVAVSGRHARRPYLYYVILEYLLWPLDSGQSWRPSRCSAFAFQIFGFRGRRLGKQRIHLRTALVLLDGLLAGWLGAAMACSCSAEPGVGGACGWLLSIYEVGAERNSVGPDNAGAGCCGSWRAVTWVYSSSM